MGSVKRTEVERASDRQVTKVLLAKSYRKWKVSKVQSWEGQCEVGVLGKATLTAKGRTGGR